MTSHILVATDGSEVAENAVDLAAELAAKFDVPLTIGHILHFGRPPEELARMAHVEHLVETVRDKSGVDFPNVPDSMIKLFDDSRPGEDSARIVTLIGDEILKRGAERAKELGASQVSTRSGQGDTADAILDMAEDVGADMIVIGHRGLGRMRRMMIGSIAQKVVQQADCTVVSVR
ncbi:MAG TPA: universal stress protein [Roseovarius sp.]|nr:universal stress protein [Roseovarius sp.]